MRQRRELTDAEWEAALEKAVREWNSEALELAGKTDKGMEARRLLARWLPCLVSLLARHCWRKACICPARRQRAFMCAYIGQSGSMRAYMGQRGCMCAYMGQRGCMRACMGQRGCMCS